MKYYVTIITFLSLFFAQAQEETSTLATDRPGASTSPGTVDAGNFQIETGANFTSFKEDNVESRSYTYNNSLFRFGIFENFEVRVTTNFQEDQLLVNDEKLDNVSSGFLPLIVGFKTMIKEENGLIPQIGLVGNLSLPLLASTDFKPETTGADFAFLMSHTLSEKSNLTYNLGAQWGNDSPEIAYLYTISYGYSILDNLGVFAEVYGNFPEDSRANYLWDAGLTYVITNNFQVDVSGGTSFTEGQDLFLSAGLSFRIPK